MALEGIFLLAALAEVERALRRESFPPWDSVFILSSACLCATLEQVWAQVPVGLATHFWKQCPKRDPIP